MRGGPQVLAIAACASGCFSDRGLAIEVDVGDTAATSIELYLGQTCDPLDNPQHIDCQSIEPKDISSPLTGTVWFRDADARYTADVHGHTASFQLRADTATTLPIIVAIGAAGGQPIGTATLRDIEIPLDSASARVIKTTLVPASPVAPADPTGTTDRVTVWTKQNPASTCVAVEHWEAGTPTRNFVVPSDDPDCDDVATECNPTAYHGSEPGGGPLTPRCFATTSSTGPGPSACVVGSIGCTDDRGLDPSQCAPLAANPVCLPSQFCSCPIASAGGGPDPACLQAQITAPDAPRLDCTVPARGTGPLFDLCTDHSSGPINLDSFYQGAKCRQPRIGSLALTDLATSHSFGGAEIELESPNDPCTFEITWKRGTRASTDADDYGVIELTARTGTLLLPITLHFQSSCVAQPLDDFQCTVNHGGDSDPLWNCAP